MNCAEYIKDKLLLGLDEGLFALEIDSARPSPQHAQSGSSSSQVRMTSMSARRYTKLDYLEDIGNVLISRSGKNDSVCLHNCKELELVKSKKFEDQTHAQKMKEAKEYHAHVVGKHG